MSNRFILKFSFDDGVVEDLHTAELLDKYGFTATFFVPNTCTLDIDDIRDLSKRHKIGGHTIHHPMDLKLVMEPQLSEEIVGNRKWLQGITGQEIDEFCYPRGRYNDFVIDAVKRAGFKTARTTLVGWHFKMPPELYRQHTTIHTYNRNEYGMENWQTYARRMLEKSVHAARKDIGYYHLWGHSHLELERNGWWGDFEDLLKEIKLAADKFQ